jgi:hypothetical protein
MSDSERLLELIENAIVEHGGPELATRLEVEGFDPWRT